MPQVKRDLRHCPPVLLCTSKLCDFCTSQSRNSASSYVSVYFSKLSCQSSFSTMSDIFYFFANPMAIRYSAFSCFFGSTGWLHTVWFSDLLLTYQELSLF